MEPMEWGEPMEPRAPTDRRVRRTQAERRSATEAALLRAASELIAERGFERTSLRSIGTRAGVSREMPAYHFGSKEQLVARLTERAHELTLEATALALERTDRTFAELSALDTIRASIETYLDVFLAADTPEERAVVVMWGATFPSESPLQAMISADRQTHRELADTIRAGTHDGSIRPDIDPDAAALVITGMARGIAAAALAHPVADAATVRRLCGDFITATLQAEPAQRAHGSH